MIRWLNGWMIRWLDGWMVGFNKDFSFLIFIVLNATKRLLLFLMVDLQDIGDVLNLR